MRILTINKFNMADLSGMPLYAIQITPDGPRLKPEYQEMMDKGRNLIAELDIDRGTQKIYAEVEKLGIKFIESRVLDERNILLRKCIHIPDDLPDYLSYADGRDRAGNKTLKQLTTQEPVYLRAFRSKLFVLAAFEGIDLKDDSQLKWLPEAIEKWKDINILFAYYDYDNDEYYGEAFVLFEQGGQLFEAHGSHQSDGGLEGQFDPEETNLEALKYRLLNGKFGKGRFSDELQHFLEG